MILYTYDSGGMSFPEIHCGGLPRTLDVTKLPLAVRPGQRNSRTAVAAPDGGTDGVRKRFSGVGVGLQTMPGGDRGVAGQRETA